MNIRNEHRVLFTIGEVSELYGVHRMTVHRWMKSKRIGYMRVGRVIRFRPEHLDEFDTAHQYIAKSAKTNRTKPLASKQEAFVFRSGVSRRLYREVTLL
jgi:excisionase family DNA binding protein